MTRWLRLLLPLLAASVICSCGTVHGASATTSSSPHATSHGAPSSGTGTLRGLRLWVDPQSPAALQAGTWRRDGMGASAALVARIASQPTAVWLTGGQQTLAEVARLVRSAGRARAVAQIVLYDIPNRDCGQYSSGGARSKAAYLAWVAGVARRLGSRPVLVIVEPDAVDQAASGCLGAAAADARYLLLARATKLLRRDANARVYLDAGDAGWLPPASVAGPLRASGIAADAGFSLNVANFYGNAATIAYGQRISALLGGKHFVIDTSRNGNGPPPGAPGVNSWCNPAGRALGAAPTTNTGNALVDAFLWIKYPGESDGTCQPDEPSAGTWWPSYALALVRNSSFTGTSP